MEDKRSSSEGKVTGIRQIVRLKGFLQKWQNVTLGQNRSNKLPLPSPPMLEGGGAAGESSSSTGISPAISKRLLSTTSYCDSDEDGCQSPEPPNGVPRGYLAVYVGPELRRFIIPTKYLSDPLFKKLLDKVEEEFGFDHSGALTIPCEIETFKFLLKCMENHDHHKEQQRMTDDDDNNNDKRNTSVESKAAESSCPMEE